jgi:hypothetical protein
MRLNQAAWRLAPALLLLAPVAALVLAGRFDGLYGQDPYAYYDYAMGPARQSLLSLRPLPPFFWPPGYPLLVALLSLLLGPGPIAGQVVSLAMGAAAVVFTLLLGEEFALAWGWPIPGAQRSALVAGLLVACTGQLWQSSAVVMADTTGLAAATLGAWALLRYGRLHRAGWLLLASAALAAALLARWIYGLVAVPAGLYVLWLLLGPQARPRRRLLHGAGATMTAAAILAPMLLPAIAGLWQRPGQAAPFAGTLQVYSWHPLNALQREFVTTDGHLSYRLPNGLYYFLAPAHRYYFTPLAAGFVLLGVFAVLRRGRGAPAAAWTMLGWAGVVYGFHAGAPWQNFRFTLAYLPPLAVLAALGFETALGWAGPRWRLVPILLLAAGLGLMVLGGAQLTRSFIVRKDGDLDTVRRVEALVPAGARLLVFGPTFTFKHYSALDSVELFYVTPDQLPAELDDGRLAYLLVDVSSLETQWRDEPVAADYRWLRDIRGLEPVEQFGSLTLFKVTGS